MSILKQFNSRNKIKNQNLFDAVTNGHIDIVKSLIESGADVNAIHDLAHSTIALAYIALYRKDI